jgi:hypothetical protein
VTERQNVGASERPRNAAGEIIDPARDRPGLVFRVLIGAIATGTALVALALWTVRTLLADAPASEQAVVNGPAFFILILGTFGAVAAAAALGWWLLAPLSSSWRRGVFAMISGFGTVVAALLSAPVHHAWGRGGLALLAGVSALIAVPIVASVRRAP